MAAVSPPIHSQHGTFCFACHSGSEANRLLLIGPFEPEGLAALLGECMMTADSAPGSQRRCSA
jgi:hypothetical protein